MRQWFVWEDPIELSECDYCGSENTYLQDEGICIMQYCRDCQKSTYAWE